VRDNVLDICQSMRMRISDSLAANVKSLREARGMTQSQIAKLAGIPRATWSNVESGDANPTLLVLEAVAQSLQVSLEELVAKPKSDVKLYKRGTLPQRKRFLATIDKLLPDAIPGMEIDRLELPSGARMAGVPHTVGTREYLACEHGVIELHAQGEKHTLERGDVLTFRGDQKHSYANSGKLIAVAYSVVVLRRS
jgi:XRE family transcriptional regulator, regulator of sulfur utilization